MNSALLQAKSQIFPYPKLLPYTNQNQVLVGVETNKKNQVTQRPPIHPFIPTITTALNGQIRNLSFFFSAAQS